MFDTTDGAFLGAFIFMAPIIGETLFLITDWAFETDKSAHRVQKYRNYLLGTDTTEFPRLFAHQFYWLCVLINLGTILLSIHLINSNIYFGYSLLFLSVGLPGLLFVRVIRTTFRNRARKQKEFFNELKNK